MKVLMIARPGSVRPPRPGEDDLRRSAEEIGRLREHGILEGAWELAGGGGAAVLNVSDLDDLGRRLREHPLIEHQIVSIHPIEEAVFWLDWWADLLEVREEQRLAPSTDGAGSR